MKTSQRKVSEPHVSVQTVGRGGPCFPAFVCLRATLKLWTVRSWRCLEVGRHAEGLDCDRERGVRCVRDAEHLWRSEKM